MSPMPMSLRLKMVVVIAALITVLGIGGTLHARLTLSRMTDDELNKRAIAISADVAGSAEEHVLTNDLYGLYLHVHQKASNNDGVRYIVVFDRRGEVRASTFPVGLPAGLREANPIPPGERFSLQTLSTTQGPVLDVAYAMPGEEAGSVRVGLTKRPLERQVNRLTLTLLGLTGGVLVVGVTASYVLATLLTRPLTRLAEAARAVGRGQAPSQAELYSHPEVGQVAIAFDAMTHELREKDRERTQLLAKVIGAQEEERKRIARELHDEAGQLLTSLLLGLTHLERSVPDPALRRQAAELRTTTAELIDLMRDMAFELRPSTLDDLGLVAALHRYAAEFGRKHTIVTDFHAVGMEAIRLRPQTETALYRIAQEALTNVARHAGASHVSLLLERQRDHAVLVVEDDGHGFDVERVRRLTSPSRKLGLLGIEERAGLVGGTVTIESRPEAGTAVFVDVPIAPGVLNNGDDIHR